MKLFFKIFPLLACLAFISSSFGQSTAEASSALQLRFSGCLQQFKTGLLETRTDPGNLIALSETVEKNIGDLQELDGEIDSQLDFVSQKEAKLGSSGLGDSDRKELLATLALQKKPLAQLKASNSAWEKILRDFNANTVKEWRSLHTSFAEIAGEDKARQKLAEKISQYVAKQPWPQQP
jgi:hypothetical protein